MACLKANLHVLPKLNPAVYSCWLHGFPTFLRFAPSWCDVVCLFTGTNHGEQLPKCQVCEIYTLHSPTGGTSADVCLNKSHGSSFKQTLNDERLAFLFPIQSHSKHRFCFVQVDEAYQPRHKRCSLPLCGPYLATSNISSINNVNTQYNVHCSENKPFAITCRRTQHIDNTFHTTTSSSDGRQELLGRRQGQSSWSVAQLANQKEARAAGTMRNTLFNQ